MADNETLTPLLTPAAPASAQKPKKKLGRPRKDDVPGIEVGRPPSVPVIPDVKPVAKSLVVPDSPREPAHETTGPSAEGPRSVSEPVCPEVVPTVADCGKSSSAQDVELELLPGYTIRRRG
jgi:hypothetical protein